MTKKKGGKQKPIIGWREWVGLPDLEIKKIKAKVDTGARTSALHAFDIRVVRKGAKKYVKFKVHPEQNNNKKTKVCRARLLEYRKVKSSNGKSELRPVILTHLVLHGEIWPIELTLTNRIDMSFRMLLGRESFKGKFLVDVGSSYFGEKTKKKVIKKKISKKKVTKK